MDGEQGVSDVWAAAPERGRLLVRRVTGPGRFGRETYGVFIDGERSGSLPDRESVEIAVDVGRHELQVGIMTYPYSGRPRLLGSPVLPIEIRAGQTCVVVTRPAAANSLRQRALPESLLILTAENDDALVRSTSLSADAAPPPTTAAGRNFLTNRMIESPHPWRSWPAIATIACLLFCGWVVVVSLFFTRSASGGWILAVVFGIVGAVFALQLVTVVRARRQRHQSR